MTTKLAAISSILVVAGCSSLPPEPITVYETRTLYQDRYVPVPERMTTPVEVIELSPDFDLPELGAGYKACKVRVQQCNGQLAEIATLKIE